MSNLIYKKYKKYYLLMLLPALSFYIFALVGPLLFGTLPFSFLKWNLISGSQKFVGFHNYIKILSDAEFWKAFLFTFKLAAFTIVGSNILGFTVAYLLNMGIRAKGVIRSMFFIPNIISPVLVAFVWVFLFTNVLPSVAEQLGWNWLAQISWFGSSDMATITIIIVSIWQGMGFLMLIYTAGLQTIPQDVLEAAKIDGCNGLRGIFRIQIPLLMPTITINLFVSIAAAFKSFDVPFALTGGGPYDSTQPVALNIYRDAFGSFEMGYGSAKSVILFLVVLIITATQLWLTRKQEVEY